MMRSIEDRVKRVISEQIGVDLNALSGEKSFVADLGCDSLDTIEIVMALEDEFSIVIDDNKAENVATVQQAIDFVSAAVAA